MQSDDGAGLESVDEESDVSSTNPVPAPTPDGGNKSLTTPSSSTSTPSSSLDGDISSTVSSEASAAPSSCSGRSQLRNRRKN